MNVVACRTALPALAALFILGCSATKEASDWHDGDLPQTVAEAVDQLVEGLDERSMSRVKFTPEDDLIGFHMGWGRSIRNSFGLWGRNELLLRDCDRRAGQRHIHPESCSQLIIEAVWERLQGMDVPYWPDPVPRIRVDSLVVVPPTSSVLRTDLVQKQEILASMIVYPELARRARIEGQSVVAFSVGEDGTVANIELVHRLGRGTDEAVIDAVQSIHFVLRGQDGKPEPATLQVYVTFEFEQPAPERR